MDLLGLSSKNVTKSASPIGFATKGGGDWKVWDRYLTVDGQSAYHLGNICGTCGFLFERMEGANQKVDVGKLASRLGEGVNALSADIVEPLSLLMPAADYRLALLRFTPVLVMPGSAEDYFAVEQVENEGGTDAFWGFPHHPKVPYYRPTPAAGVSVTGPEARHARAEGELFEFVVPVFPENWLNSDRIEFYAKTMENGTEPTAIAVSVMDVKGPAMTGTDHWCLAHFLLDGHHKVAAAARAGRPLTLLAFIALDRGISTPEHVEIALGTYSNLAGR